MDAAGKEQAEIAFSMTENAVAKTVS